MTADRMNLLKGGISVAALWYFWYRRDRQGDHRRVIIATVVGIVLAIFLSRFLAAALPFRSRPLYTPDIGYRPPAISLTFNAEDWSSFPSDHMAMWLAIAYGIWSLSRLAGVIAILYTMVWIGLVRVYLGIHYPSDLAAGAAIGWLCGWTALRLPLAPLTEPLLKIEQRFPSVFYPMMFLLSYEIANIFDDARIVMHGLHLIGHHA